MNKTIEEIKDDYNYSFNIDEKENKFYDEFTPSQMWEWINFHFTPNSEVQKEIEEAVRKHIVGFLKWFENYEYKEWDGELIDLYLSQTKGGTE